METNGRRDGRTDGGDCITSHANEVGNKVSLALVTPPWTEKYKYNDKFPHDKVLSVMSEISHVVLTTPNKLQ